MKKFTFNPSSFLQYCAALLLVLSCSITQAQTTPVNLNNQLKGTAPSGTTLQWFTDAAHSTAYATPTAAMAGTYYAFFVGDNPVCYGPGSKIIVATNTCASTTVDLSTHVSGTPPSGSTVEWFTTADHTGSPVATPTTVGNGKYYAFFKDSASGCYGPASEPVIVALTAALTAPVASVTTDISCTATTGTITVSSPAAATGYKLTGPSPSTASSTNDTGVFTGLAPGDYTVSYTNASGCLSSTITKTIAAVPASFASSSIAASKTDTDCTTPKGTITVTAPASGSGYSYSLDNSSFQDSNVFSGLNPNNYTVYVKNTTSGCVTNSGSNLTTINNQPITPAAPTLSGSATGNYCEADTITITSSATSGNQWYKNGTIITGETGASLTVTAPGTYTVKTTSTTTACTSAASAGGVDVTINPLPIAAITQGAELVFATACTTNVTPITLTAAAQPVNVTGTPSYQWLFRATPSATWSTLATTSATHAANAEGFYKVKVTVNGCSSESTITRIYSPVVIDVTTTAVCAGQTVTLDASATTVVNPVYKWFKGSVAIPSATAATYVATTSGNYTVEVSPSANPSLKSTSCAVTVTVNPLPTVTIASSPANAAACSGTPVTLTATATGATSYTYKWYKDNSLTAITTPTYTANSPGSYKVEVTDNNGCSATTTSQSVTINELPAAPTASITTNTSCIVSKGTIEITPVAGATYSIDGTTYQAGYVFVNLSPATYTVYVKNTNGCSTASTATYTINAVPTAPAATSNIVFAQPTCGIPTGSVAFTAVSGLEYSVNDFATTTTISPIAGLAPGATYTLKARSTTDTTCVAATTSAATATISAVPTALAAPSDISFVQPTCGTATGSVSFTAVSGFQYSVNDFATTTTTSPITGLQPGSTYILKARSTTDTTCVSAASTATMNAQPTAPAEPSNIVFVQPTCGTPTGSVSFTVVSGMEYSVDNFATAAKTASPITGLVAGSTYTLKARRTSDTTCVSTSASAAATATINAVPTAPAEPSNIVFVQPTCTVATGSVSFTAVSGMEYSVDNFATAAKIASPITGLVAGSTYILKARSTTDTTCVSAASTATMNAQPTAPAEPSNIVFVQPTCTVATGSVSFTAVSGFQYSVDNFATTTITSPITGLVVGSSYTLKARSTTDTTCVSAASAASTATMNAQPATPAAVVANVSAQPSCTVSTGTITVTPVTGVDYAVRGTSPVTTEVKNNTGIFNNLAPGVYDVMAVTSSGCYSSPISLTVVPNATSPATPTASVTVQPSCSIATGTIKVSSPVPGSGISYSLAGISPVVTAVNNTTGDFTNLAPGVYNVTTLSGGCTSGAVNLTVTAQPITPDAATITYTQASCTAKGSITVTAPTGSGYTYSIDGTTFQAATTFANLAQGTYTVTVKSAGGCNKASTSTTTINAQPATPAVVTASVSSQPSCTVATGTITVTAPANATGITYTITGTTVVASATNATGIFTGLAPGKYDVTTTAGACSSTALNLTVDAQPAIPTAAVPTASTGTNACPVKTFNLKTLEPAAVNGVTYEWWTGGTATAKGALVTNSVATTTGDYFLWSKLSGGCYSAAGSSAVKITIDPCYAANVTEFTVLLYNDVDKNCTISATESGLGLPITSPMYVKLVNSSNVAVVSSPLVVSPNGFTSLSVDSALIPDGAYKLIIDNNNTLTDVTANYPSFWTGNALNITLVGGLVQETFPAAAPNIPLCLYSTAEIKPDYAVTEPKVPSKGDLSTNDKLPAGSTYGQAIPDPSNPAGATMVVNPDGSYTFNGTQPGKYKYTVPVCPAGQTTGCPTSTIEFTVVDPKGTNNKPIANNDIASVINGSSVVTTILANDKSGNALTILNPASVTIATAPAHGVARVNPDGTIKYTPTIGFVGTDVLTYNVCDTSTPAQCETATVTYTVYPEGIPLTITAEDDFDRTMSAVTISGNVLKNDANTNGLTLSATPLTVVSPAQGQFTLNPDGTYTFVPAAGFSGPLEVVYNACTVTPALCAKATLHILVTPETNIKPDFAVSEPNVPAKGDLSTNDKLPAGSTYGQAIPDPSNPAGGKLDVKPDGTYTFTGTQPGTYKYTVPVCPAGQTTGCPTTTIDVTVVDPNAKTSKPVVNPDIATVATGGSVTTNVLGNDKATTPGATIDPASVTITQPANGTAVKNPDGTIKYTPNPGFVGTDSVTYTVCDNGTPKSCQSSTVTYNVTEAAAAPSVTVVDDYTKTPSGTPVSGSVLTNDAHTTAGTVLTATVLTAPTAAQGTLTMNTNGTYTFVPAPGFSGPLDVVYNACGGTPSVCSKGTLHILVAAPLNDELVIFNGISANGDSANDYFKIQNIESYPNNTVEIYNRWGVKVFEVDGYGINGNVFRGLSDGRATMSRGVELPEGTYFYIIRYANSEGLEKKRAGYLYIKQ